MRREKTDWFRRRMLDFLKKAGREHLPWRRKGITAYAVWVSEIMLQQTQVSRVTSYYERFLKRFPTVDALARASWRAFLPYYRGLGYYARGRNMLRTAKVIVERHHREFPRTVEALQALPGIGPYTARAIASFAYGEPLLAWDTNVRRVLGRFFCGGKERVLGREESLERVFGKDAPWLNAALMDFGSSLCGARPKCAACMLRSRCSYFRTRGKLEAPRVSVRNPAAAPVRTLVYVHAGHRQYYSATRTTFQPFRLPRGIVRRADIKQYFLERYGLELSVRPPHGKERLRGEWVALVNAQILLGQPDFMVFAKAAVLEYNRKGISLL